MTGRGLYEHTQNPARPHQVQAASFLPLQGIQKVACGLNVPETIVVQGFRQFYNLYNDYVTLEYIKIMT
jgi:hypothetical protein